MNVSKMIMAISVMAVLTASAVDSSDYIRDGLVLQFDGIDNAGTGQHLSDLTTWKDLVGSRDLTLPTDATVGADAVFFEKVSAALSGITELASDAVSDFTLEVVCRTDGTYSYSTTPRVVVGNPRVSLFFRDLTSGAGLIGSTYFADGQVCSQGIPNRYSNYSNLAFIRDVHSYSVRQSASSHKMSIDGGLEFAMATKFGSSAGELSEILTVGDAGCNLAIKSIRLYNRTLSGAEAAKNAAIDKVRFSSDLPVDELGEKSAFSDAVYWLRTQIRNNNEAAGSTSLPNALRLGATTRPWDAATVVYAAANIKVETADVPYPCLGRTVKNRPILHLTQSSGASLLYQDIPVNATNRASYTVFARFKIEERMTAGGSVYLLNVGYNWSGRCGAQFTLSGTDDNNLWLRIHHGGGADDFKAMQSLDDAYHLKVGKWIDLALTTQGRNNWLYYQVEGGKLYSQLLDADCGLSTGPTYTLRVGADGAESGAWNPKSGLTNFKGWIDQIAVWNRTLSKDEVLAAFRGDAKDGDAFRLGVPNDSCEEFAGTGDAVLSDRADWRNAAKTLAAGSSMNVKFDMPDAEKTALVRTFKFKSTSASPELATVGVKLNGMDVAPSLAVGRGLTASAQVSSALFNPTGNVLTVTRSDSGEGALEIDCMSLVAAEGVVDPAGSPVEGDVFADAIRWNRDIVDRDGNGCLFDSDDIGTVSTEFPDAFHAAVQGSNAGIWQKSGMKSVKASNFAIEPVSVKCPAAGVTLENENCLRFVSPSFTNEQGSVRASYSEIAATLPPVTNTLGHSGIIRIRFDGFVNPASPRSEIFSVGYDWTNDRGTGLGIDGSRHIVAYCGRATLYFALPEGQEPFRAGEWMDLGYTMSNGWCRVFVQREGGGFLSLGAQNSHSTGSGTAQTTLHLGTSNNYAAYQEEKYVGFRGLVHQIAVWRRALTEDEVMSAFAWPRRDLFRLGAANGTSYDFAGTEDVFTIPENGAFHDAKPTIMTSGGTYTVKFSVPSDQVNKNQLLRVVTTQASSDAVLSVELNGKSVFYFNKEREKIETLVAASGEISEFGVHKSFLKEGENVLVLKRVDANDGALEFDALSLGNGGKTVHVGIGNGLVLIVK